MSKRIVITGVGAVSALGLTTETFWSALCHGQSGITPLPDGFDGVKMAIGAMLPDFDPAYYFSPDEIALLDRFSKYAVLAAQQAIADAGLTVGDSVVTKAAAIIGSGCGGKHTDEATYTQLYKNNGTRAHPLTIPKGMPSAAASMVSRHLGVRGPVFSIASACASGSHAISQGSMMIQSGNADVAIVGGTDAPFTYGLLKAWDALRVISRDNCRPFCKTRSGTVLGEGAGIIVLESEEHALKRGARIYAELSGYGMSSDAGHVTRPDVSGMSLAMANAIEHSGMQTNEVQYINAHGTGTLANDEAETKAIHRVFGKHADNLAISSTKSMHGHALGASSALEIIATILALHHNIIPPTINYVERDELCDLDYVPNQAREQKLDVALSNSFAFGGLNISIALKAY